MISACVVPTVKHGGGGVMVWGCFAGYTVWDLFRIQGKLNQHGYHSILQLHAIPSGLRLVGLLFPCIQVETYYQQEHGTLHVCKSCIFKEKIYIFIANTPLA